VGHVGPHNPLSIGFQHTMKRGVEPSEFIATLHSASTKVEAPKTSAMELEYAADTPSLINFGRLIFWFIVAVTAWAAVGGIRRVWFSPLSKFPGPKLAWLTLWNEFYWDVVCRGTFMWRIQAMHERYGSPRPREKWGCRADFPHRNRPHRQSQSL